MAGRIRQIAEAESERSFSYLYVANVLGALLGTTVSAFLLIELVGFRGTLHITSAFNGILAASALLISFGPLPSRGLTTLVGDRKSQTRLYGLPQSIVLWMLFTTGVVSMGMEVVWVRQFTPYLGNVVYAFAGILSVYLLATFWGSRDYRSWIRSHQLGESARAWTLVGVFALIPLAAADLLLPLRIGSVELAGARLAAIVPFCGLVGFLTPMLVDSWSSGDPARAGRAYAVNVLGSILGPLLAGFWLLPWLGERWALVALSLPLFGLAFDQRFAMVLVGSSGKGGATLLRRNFGEAVENLTGGEYYWIAGNFMKYGTSDATFGSKNARDLPVDSHELIVLCAPRLTFISYGVPREGRRQLARPARQLHSGCCAKPCLHLAWGKGAGRLQDYRTAQMPPVNAGLLNGQLAWRQHDGRHTDAPNTQHFLKWADGFIGHLPPTE